MDFQNLVDSLGMAAAVLSVEKKKASITGTLGLSGQIASIKKQWAPPTMTTCFIQT